MDNNGRRGTKLGGLSFLDSMLKDYLSESGTPSRDTMSPTSSALAKYAVFTASGVGFTEFRGFLGEKKPLILLNDFGFD